MAFRRVADPQEAVEYYQYGLLWEQMGPTREREPAHGWHIESLEYCVKTSQWPELTIQVEE